MEKTNESEGFNTKAFITTFISFMIFINILYFFKGAFFTEGGYVFDVSKHIFEQLPAAFLCSFGAAFINKREK